MNDRFKFKAVLKTSEFTILVKPYYILEDSYFIDINQAETEFENKYPEECFWDFIDEIKKQDYIQEISSDSDLIITKDFTNLIQCTGFKDKNGKLIYEGDIVKCGKWDLAARDSFRDDEYIEQVGVINYYNNRCRFVVNRTTIASPIEISLPETCLGILGDCYIEVIGNIYENKELLECQK